MLRWKKILAATDFSPSSEVALRSAETLARQGGGTVIVVNVVEPIPPHYTVRPSAPGVLNLDERSMGEARKALDRVAAGSRKRHAQVKSVLRVGRPWAEILEVAGEQGVEAICLGNSGRSAFERLVMGSTAENVVRRSSVPVLVTRDRPLEEVRRITVPVDFDPGSKLALRVALEAFPARTELTAVHVAVPVSPFDPMVGIIVPDEEQIGTELEGYLGPKTLRRARPEVRVMSDRTSGILQHAEEHEADLVVIATHGRRGLARALLGSTAEKVVRHADRPVLVLPGPGRGWAPATASGAAGARPRRAKSRPGRPRSLPKGRSGRGPWTGQAHTGRGGPAGRRGAGSTAGKRKGGRKTPSKGEER